MTDPTKLIRLLGQQQFEHEEDNLPVRGIVQAYNGTTVQVLIPSFDGGIRPFPVDYVGADFQQGDLVLVCRDEADTYWIISTQYLLTSARAIQSTQDATPSGGAAGQVGSLPANAGNYLNSKQMQFAARLSADIGFEPAVICGWIHSEEPKSQTPDQMNGANNWLNIGSWDQGNWSFGGSNVWDTPVSAADATASFIFWRNVNGVMSPARSLQPIHDGLMGAMGKGTDAQITAIQTCGWATSGYPSLPQIVALFKPAGVPGHPELKSGISSVTNQVMQQWPSLTISSTTGGTHVSGSYHYEGRAVDLVADSSYMDNAAQWIANNLTSQLTEGIHNPGLSVKNGQTVPSSYWGSATWAEHVNHIHLAV
jgi:hypothetical protein